MRTACQIIIVRSPCEASEQERTTAGVCLSSLIRRGTHVSLACAATPPRCSSLAYNSGGIDHATASGHYLLHRQSFTPFHYDFKISLLSSLLKFSAHLSVLSTSRLIYIYLNSIEICDRIRMPNVE